MKSTHLTRPTHTAKGLGAQGRRDSASSGAVTASFDRDAFDRVVDRALDQVPVDKTLQVASNATREVSDDVASDLASKARANRRTVQVVGSAAIGFLGGLLAASA